MQAERLEMIDGKSPTHITAAAIYIGRDILEGRNRTQREIADVSSVTEVTMKSLQRIGEWIKHRDKLTTRETAYFL